MKKMTMISALTKEIMINIKIKGLGTDIIEVERIQDSIKKYKDRFLSRIFTEDEIAYCMTHKNPERNFAGRFAAKEAVAKALGHGIGKDLSWKDIEIRKDKKGKPLVSFSLSAQKKFKKPNVMLSISHCKEYANAIAIWL